MKSQVLLNVWCNISGGAGGEIWHWSLSGVKGLTGNRAQALTEAPHHDFTSRCVFWRVGGPVTFPQNPVQLRGAMDKSAQIYADESEMGPRLGVLPNHRQVTPLEQPVCNAGAYWGSRACGTRISIVWPPTHAQFTNIIACSSRDVGLCHSANKTCKYNQPVVDISSVLIGTVAHGILQRLKNGYGIGQNDILYPSNSFGSKKNWPSWKL